jgi:antirestriction protein ArdC
MPSLERYQSTPPEAYADEHEWRPATALVESLNRLEQAVSRIQDSETFRRFLDAQARFHAYSWGNVLLILAQRPDATQVAGFRTWQAMGRYVRRGERGIRIIVPMRRRNGRVSDEDGQDAEALTRLYFGTGSVFDVSQTGGQPLPEVAVPTLEGEQGRGLYARLSAIAISESVDLQEVAELPGQMMGYYQPESRRIVLRQAAPRQMTKTLAHELAHHFGGGTTSNPEEETCAEAVAYVVCARFGLDTGERSFPYIAIWSREPKTLKAAMTRIQAVSALMIDRLGAEQTEATTSL